MTKKSNFFEKMIIKKGLEILLLLPRRDYMPSFRKNWIIRLGEKVLQTNRWTNWTEIIGFTGKIPGTKKSTKLSV